MGPPREGLISIGRFSKMNNIKAIGGAGGLFHIFVPGVFLLINFLRVEGGSDLHISQINRHGIVTSKSSINRKPKISSKVKGDAL